jgi:hypothetical protein
MLGWLFGVKKKQDTAATRGHRLNEDLIAYVRTFPVADRLREHLATQGRSDEFAAIKATLDLAIADTGDFLYAQSSAIRWGPELESTLYLHLSERHAWLTHGGFASLKGYAGWLSWHEGLNAS